MYEADNNWRLRKDVHARNLRWTVTDTDISPTEQFLIYSSITPDVHLVWLAVFEAKLAKQYFSLCKSLRWTVIPKRQSATRSSITPDMHQKRLPGYSQQVSFLIYS